MSILRVDTIQHSNGTAALTIDSSGRVLRATVPAFTVYNNGASAAASGATITYNTTRWNIGSSMNISTGLFTAPIAGFYFFSFQSLVEINNTAIIEVFFRKNGASLNYTRAYDAENVTTPYGPTVTITTIEQLSLNDTMSVYLNSGSFHGNFSSQFCGYLIG